jgi:hypothetical protein
MFDLLMGNTTITSSLKKRKEKSIVVVVASHYIKDQDSLFLSSSFEAKVRHGS